MSLLSLAMEVGTEVLRHIPWDQFRESEAGRARWHVEHIRAGDERRAIRAALECLRGGGIPAHELDTEYHIGRWLNESWGGNGGASRLHDYLLLSWRLDDNGRPVVGAVLWCTLYPRIGYVFVSALGMNEHAETSGAIRFVESGYWHLMKYVLTIEEFREAKCIVFESEFPDARNPLQEEAERAERRLSTFSRTLRKLGYTAFRVPVEFNQPATRLSEASEFTPLLLCAAVREGASGFVSRRDIVRIVSFVYDMLYQDAFEKENAGATESQLKAYRATIDALRARALTPLVENWTLENIWSECITPDAMVQVDVEPLHPECT